MEGTRAAFRIPVTLTDVSGAACVLSSAAASTDRSISLARMVDPPAASSAVSRWDRVPEPRRLGSLL